MSSPSDLNSNPFFSNLLTNPQVQVSQGQNTPNDVNVRQKINDWLAQFPPQSNFIPISDPGLPKRKHHFSLQQSVDILDNEAKKILKLTDEWQDDDEMSLDDEIQQLSQHMLGFSQQCYRQPLKTIKEEE